MSSELIKELYYYDERVGGSPIALKAARHIEDLEVENKKLRKILNNLIEAGNSLKEGNVGV